MKFLAIDLASNYMTAALAKDGSLLAASSLYNVKTASRVFTEMIEQLLHLTGCNLSDIGFIGVIQEPDSLNVKKLSQAVRKLGQELNIPVMKISALEFPKKNLNGPQEQVIEEFWQYWQKAYPEKIKKRQVKKTGKSIVRLMRQSDIKDVMKIELRSFSTPWTPLAFISELRYNEDAHYFCLLLDNKVIGYLGLWFTKDTLSEGYITNIAVAPDHRGHGWGKYLLIEVMKRLYKNGMEYINLEVRASNQAARSFYKRLGFIEKETIKSYYTDTQEDALIMRGKVCEIISHEEKCI